MKPVSATFLLVFCLLKIAGGVTVRVGEGLAFTSIRKGLEYAKAGDTVLVSPGVYKEGNLIINKPVKFIGIGFPVLDGNKQSEVLSIKSNNVLVQGFHLRRSGRGTLDDPGAIKIYESEKVYIAGNHLSDNFFGIYLQYCKNCHVENNVIEASGKEEQEIGNGIHCWKSDSLTIVGNNIKGHRDGIYFEFVTHSVIWRNISKKNIRYGLHFMFSDNDAYFSNLFSENGAGVAVMYTRNVTMMNNTFIDNWGDAAYGILLKEISDCYMSGNHFQQNTVAIFMDGTSRMNVFNNHISGNGWGMKVQANCMDNNIECNNFIGNSFDVATNGSLTLNNFSSNYWDKYEGYDLNKDFIGDVPYRPLSLFSMIVEQNPPVIMLYRSFMVTLLDRSEKLLPSLTPEAFVDLNPRTKPFRS